MTDLQALVAWLNSDKTAHHDHDAVAVSVLLGIHRYEGARFLRERPANDRYPAHTDTIYYLLGKFPADHMEGGEVTTGTTYLFDGDAGDWYLGAYCPDADPHNRLKLGAHCSAGARFEKACPFGPNFMLMRWPHEMFGTRIDSHGTRRRGARQVPSTSTRVYQSAALGLVTVPE